MTSRVDSKKPINPHVRGIVKLSFMQRMHTIWELLIGGQINWAFCNKFQACFSREGRFLGIDYLGSVPQIVVGKPQTCDIKYIDAYHLVIEGEEDGDRTSVSSSRG